MYKSAHGYERRVGGFLAALNVEVDGGCISILSFYTQRVHVFKWLGPSQAKHEKTQKPLETTNYHNNNISQM